MAYAVGLIPVRHEDGSPWNGATVRCQVLAAYGTAIFVGDPVIAVGAGTAVVVGESSVADGVYQVVERAAAGGVIYGVVVGIEPGRDNLSNKHIPASTGGTIMVARATPELIFLAGEDGAVDPLELIDIGAALDLTAGTGNTATGYSGFTLDSSSHGTAAKQVYLRGLYNSPGNVDNVDTATATDTIWEVSIMEIQFGQAPVGLGV